MPHRLLVVEFALRSDYRESLLGTLLPAFTEHGYDVAIHCFDCDAPKPSPDPSDFDAVLVTGSPESAFDDTLPWIDDARQLMSDTVDQGVPTLGVCFGAQMLAIALGGSVARSTHPEHGFVEVESTRPDLIGPGPWLESHIDTITVPDGVDVIATNDAGVQAFVSGPHLGVQFHPEVTPEVLTSWYQGFIRRSHHDSGDVDRAAMAAAVAARIDESAADCRELVDRFLRHAALPLTE
ncbi:MULTISPECIES: type 1 glutamine amidotransferase [unclassified Gordonia (in: high G+C Gram-positive bacteria)]